MTTPQPIAGPSRYDDPQMQARMALAAQQAAGGPGGLGNEAASNIPDALVKQAQRRADPAEPAPPMSQQQRAFLLAQQQRQAPSALGRPPVNAAQQRQQFIASLASFHKQAGLPLPPAIFNGERDGAIKVGEAWIDVLDLFMGVVKNGGISNNLTAESPIWSNLLRGVPNPLPPMPMPRINNDPSAPVQITTDPVQYLVAAYFAWLQGFEHHMNKSRQIAFARQQPPVAQVVQQLVNKGKKAKGKKVDKPTSPAETKKRKRNAKATVSGPVDTPRPRYRVEYRPIHKPASTLAGWDRNAIAATFPKNSLLQGTKSIHDLGIVDMEAVLMSLRSRIASELGYALTVLSMLSMPHPEEQIGGLPLHHLQEIFLELLDLIVEGLQAGPSEHLPFSDLEQLGRDFDYSLDQPPTTQNHIVLAGMNILRNFSMLGDNQEIMASRPELLHLLAAVTEARLCILDLARVRRDAVVILTNIGNYVRLTPSPTTLSIFRLVSTFLTSTHLEPIYGASPSPTLSINRALEAFCKIASSDWNRDVLSSIPSSQLVELFSDLIKLLPLTQQQFEAMHSVEECLAHYECLALSLYSLAFLSPPSTRTLMRNVPGALSIISRVVLDTALQKPEFKSNPFAILCRRLCETLGVLNGTVSASGTPVGMSFSAGGIDGAGWKFASKKVDSGWLAAREEEILGVVMGVRGMDLPAFDELEGMCWGVD